MRDLIMLEENREKPREKQENKDPKVFADVERMSNLIEQKFYGFLVNPLRFFIFNEEIEHLLDV